MPTSLSSQKVIVFDLDETLGSFVQIGIFWETLTHIHGKEMNKETLFLIFDLFPNIFRPSIFKIMKYIKDMKKQKKCDKVMVYTNNQGPRSWAQMIVDYFHKKLNSKIFDQIISAFKVDGKKVELLRTSHDKTHKDLIRCAKLPVCSEICFIDDQYHPLMKHDNIFYINVKPYVYTISFTDIADKYYKHGKFIISKEVFVNLVKDFTSNYTFSIKQKTADEINIDKIIGKYMLSHIKDFFKKQNKKTRKKVLKLNMRKTKKNK